MVKLGENKNFKDLKFEILWNLWNLKKSSLYFCSSVLKWEPFLNVLILEPFGSYFTTSIVPKVEPYLMFQKTSIKFNLTFLEGFLF